MSINAPQTEARIDKPETGGRMQKIGRAAGAVILSVVALGAGGAAVESGRGFVDHNSALSKLTKPEQTAALDKASEHYDNAQKGLELSLGALLIGSAGQILVKMRSRNKKQDEPHNPTAQN